MPTTFFFFQRDWLKMEAKANIKYLLESIENSEKGYLLHRNFARCKLK